MFPCLQVNGSRIHHSFTRDSATIPARRSNGRKKSKSNLQTKPMVPSFLSVKELLRPSPNRSILNPSIDLFQCLRLLSLLSSPLLQQCRSAHRDEGPVRL